MSEDLNPNRGKYKFRTICINRSHPDHFDETTYLCSRNGLVDIQCCIECEQQALETPEEKKQRQIRLNQRLIEFNLSEIGRLRQENLKILGEALEQ